MKKRTWLILSLLFPIIFFVGWIGYMEDKIQHASEIVIRAEGYDPRNLISGHYLSLRLNWQETDCSQFSDNLCHPNRFESVYEYYIPEEYAQKLDKLVQDKQVKVDLVFAYPSDKKPYLKRLHLNGIYWQDWIKSQNI